MNDSSSTALAWTPLPVLPPLVAWTVEADGRFSSNSGPAAELAAAGVYRVGQHFEDSGLGDAAKAANRLALSGQRFADIVEDQGRRWFALIVPEFGPRGEVLRAHGTGFLLPEGAVGLDLTPGLLTHTCTYPIRGERLHVRPGEVVIDDGEAVSVTRTLPREAATLLRQHYGGPRLRAFAPAPPPRDLPAPAPAPPLRLV